MEPIYVHHYNDDRPRRTVAECEAAEPEPRSIALVTLDDQLKNKEYWLDEGIKSVEQTMERLGRDLKDNARIAREIREVRDAIKTLEGK